MTPGRWLRRGVGIAGAITVASVARADAPADQYELFDMNDVVIQDHFTQLVWQRYPELTTMTFDAAAGYCQGLSLGSYTSGWRVPSYKELLTLVDENPHFEYENGIAVPKAIDRSAFGVTPTAIATPTTDTPLLLDVVDLPGSVVAERLRGELQRRHGQLPSGRPTPSTCAASTPCPDTRGSSRASPRTWSWRSFRRAASATTA